MFILKNIFLISILVTILAIVIFGEDKNSNTMVQSTHNLGLDKEKTNEIDHEAEKVPHSPTTLPTPNGDVSDESISQEHNTNTTKSNNNNGNHAHLTSISGITFIFCIVVYYFNN
uniref:Merozoite surface protein 2 n=1 Tax=Strongyloides papillosus TaxID=174720 RepID=A0A0N5B897_STREA